MLILSFFPSSFALSTKKAAALFVYTSPSLDRKGGFFAFISIFEMLDRIVQNFQSYARSLNHRDATKTHFIKFILDSRTMHAV